MVVARLIAGALALATMPNSTSAESTGFVRASLEAPLPPAAFAAYAPTCNAPCGWAALPFAR